MRNQNASVLVIEDNPLNLVLACDLLTANGYQVLKATEGLEGWKLACKHQPDLILMDIQLPDVSGMEVTKWIKNEEKLKSIPVIAVTSFAMYGDKETILNTGCDDYISKPFSLSDFLQIVEKHLLGPGDHSPNYNTVRAEAK